MKKQIISEEFKKMQKIAGIKSLNENEEDDIDYEQGIIHNIESDLSSMGDNIENEEVADEHWWYLNNIIKYCNKKISELPKE